MEADTTMLYIYANLQNSGYKDVVVLDAADTDVYIAAVFISHFVPVDLLKN